MVQTTIPHPADQMNPTGKAQARYANVHFNRHREKPVPAETAPSVSQILSPLLGPPSAPCDRKLEAGFWLCGFVCVRERVHLTVR